MVLGFATVLIAPVPAAAATPPPAPTPHWQVQPTPLPDYGDGGSWQDGYFEAVSCPTTSFCIALGGGTFQAPESLGGLWDGKSWSLDGTSISGLEDNQGISSPAISCVSPKRCFAVVDAANIDTEIAGYATWNGNEWSETNDLPGEKQGDELLGISCPSNKFCMAVGQIGGDTPFTLAYNGHKWRKVPVPRTRAQQLNGVACPSANACFAVGPSPGGGQLGLIERWNGRAWRAQRAPVAARARSISLMDVSCSNQNACVAVGSYKGPAKNSHVLALGWNGRGWRRLSFGNTSGDLSSVSCVAGGTCVAVGSLSREPVARVWDGTRWNLQQIPNGAYAGVSGVSCATASYCMTVGTLPGGVAPFAASYF
jgi:hypothetical protein